MPSFRSAPCILLLFGGLLGLGPIAAGAQPVTQPFTFNIAAHDLPAVLHGSTSWGDIDGDGDLDLLLTGVAAGNSVSHLYVNQGKQNGTFHFSMASAPFEQVRYSSSSFADVDGDGDLDILLAGSRTASWPYAPVTEIYRLDGGGAVSRIENHGLPALHSTSMAWGDLDRDGDADLVMLGSTAGDEPMTVVAINDGNGSFAAHTDRLPGFSFGDVALGDIDGDLDLDVVLTGATTDGFQTRIFANQGSSFQALSTALPGVAFSSVDLGDYDGDNDLDLVVTGGQVSERIFEGVLEVWTNSGGAFQRLNASFPGVLAGDVSWSDYDHDGDLDLLVQGAEAAIGRRSSRVWQNQGATGFRAATLLVGSIFADTEWGDLDGDGDLDLIATGGSSLGPAFTNVYENARQVIPVLPGVPQSLHAEVSGPSALLSWQPAAEMDETNRHTTFNVRVGTTPGGSDVLSAMADARTGRRLVTGPGNAPSDGQLQLEGLTPGTYFWSVQSVNHAFLSSGFASEGSFSISSSHAVDTESVVLPTRFAIHGNYPNPFASRTTIRYDLPETADVQLRIISLLGREVYRQQMGTLPPGEHEVSWDGATTGGQQARSGIYFYEIRAAGSSATGTMTLVR
ncbi:MAG: FG-GAP-like repeat-containing protein [Bacteroidetes bacterium]|nr:FG-GAP-like repeat-containing protein [Bacteroidota bacterium]